MSQQYASYPPPPPSPRQGGMSPVPGAVSGSAHGHYQQQSRPAPAHLLPSITTAFVPSQGGYASQASTPTPTSGNRVSPGGGHLQYVPATPSALNPRTPGGLPPPPPQTPVMEPYNPRQWRGQVSGSQMVFQQRQNAMPPSTSNATGMEAAMPSPPPPYSPRTPDDAPRGAVASPMLESIGFTASPMAERAATNSPQVPMSPAFPPPPGQSSRHRDRSASGLAGNKSFFSLSGLRGKQPVTTEQQQIPTSSGLGPSFVDPRPPGARRAASTGHLQTGGPVASSSASGSTSHSSQEPSWQPGMPLPGPPPGPPPPGTRSQSLNRPAAVSSSGRNTPDGSLEAPRARRTAAAAPTLGTVPPTPANWNEQDAQGGVQDPAFAEQSSQQADTYVQPLRIDTGSNRESGLARRPAHRDSSAQGIRERRSRSRATGDPNDDGSRPANLIFSPAEGSIRRRREHTRTMSGYAEPTSAPSPPASQLRHVSKPSGSVLTPPYTPAVGKQAIKVPGSASSDRPISHILHVPNEDSGNMAAPLSPARPASAASTAPVKSSPRLDSFALQAMERHREFIAKEAMAATDEARLELFTNFIVHESRLRRDRYTAAYNAMAGDILDLTRDMWRSYSGRNSRRAATPSSAMSSIDRTVPSWASDGQPSAHGNIPSSASSTGDFTPATDAGSMGESPHGMDRSESRQWADTFKPSLSPIPSMAVSTVPDEDSSRGRTASRWWESQSGGGSIGKPDRIEKTRRETKYMGVSPAALQDYGNQAPSPGASAPQYAYGPDEYPPEKVGWHEGGEFETPMATPHRASEYGAATPGRLPLDVSRLVTLPPPYPRHHPAVNNSHPRLSDLRGEHRMLADHTDIERLKNSYPEDERTSPREQQEAINQRRMKLRSEIQSKIADGSMSFADAASAEANFEAEEAEKGKAAARAKFDAYEASVSHPLNILLTERLDKANSCIARLREDLERGRASSNRDQAQEEGDEHPERLEKLTLLKWLFEAREQLHKEMYELHAMRSDNYSEVVLTPFRIQKAQAKIDDATAFFTKDSMDRQISYAKDSLKRLEELQAVIDRNVSLGVEDQLSAFWDIAPGLVEVIQQVPARMAGFEIHIPSSEYEENPSYHDHPLQYLYSLLGHAEKSAYQFIESQINLLCLLHEVRTASTNSRLRVLELERNSASADDSDMRAEMVQARREAENHLTADLKEKVGEVERQWQQALGDSISECKERVSIWLEESGGLEEDGIDG